MSTCMTAPSTLSASAVSAVETGFHDSALLAVVTLGVPGLVVLVLGTILLARAEKRDLPKIAGALVPMVTALVRSGIRFRRQPPR